MRIRKPLWTGVVEVREGALLEGLGGSLVTGNGTLGVAGDRFVDPFDPFRRIEPAVAQLYEPGKAIEVGKLPDDDERPVVVDMDPAADPVLFWAGKRSRREVPVLPLQRNEVVSESRIEQPPGGRGERMSWPAGR